MYIVAQISGAISAALLGLLIYNENIFNLAPAPKVSGGEVLIMEIIGSTLFYTVILVQGDKDAKLSNDRTTSTITITAGLAGGIAMAGNISGGGLNPAIAFGFNFCRLLTTGKIEDCKFLWAYILGPVTAAYLASYFYLNVFRKYFILENNDEKKKPLIEMNDLE
jgi:glycerol uptake facilitator-like aquaporin